MPLVVGPVEIYIPLEGMVDVDAQRKSEKQLADTVAQIARLEQLLAGDFAEKAPAAVVAKERERLAAFKETAGKLRLQLGR
jgi:valyl-tRNA synthetase